MEKRRKVVKIVCIVLAVLMLGSAVSSALIIMVRGQSSGEILKELEKLRGRRDEIQAEGRELSNNIAANESETKNLVTKKSEIDQQIALSQESVENLNQQIQQYSLLIAEKQDELDASIAEENAMMEQYKTRLRTMEETGSVSYWSILFDASDFSDLLDRVDMIHEIAESDQLMLKQIAEITAKVKQERGELEDQKKQLEAAEEELKAEQAVLEEQRAESDVLILQMREEYEALSEEYLIASEKEDEIRKKIKETETAYYNALSKEEAARIAEQNRKNNNKVPANSGSNVTTTSTGAFLFPVPGAGASITDAYGMRWHPIRQCNSFHTGVDFAVPMNTPILASKSGTVTATAYGEANGNYVTINHGDGYSTLYAHLNKFNVKSGAYVKQGDVIGYVGDTGWSTGPHLHFEILYNGANVNPMSYVSIS